MSDENLCHILVVEDKERDFGLIRQTLEASELNCQVEYVSRGEIAVERLAEGGIDIMLLDYHLPGMDGILTYREMIKKDLVIPTIFVTGSGSEYIAVDAMKLGVDDYIVKDLSSDYLVLLPMIIAKLQDQSLQKKHLRNIPRDRLPDSYRSQVEQFIYAISHDLQAPLRVLKTYSQFLQEDHGDELSDDAKDYLEGIAESSEQLDTMLWALLSYSRLGREEEDLKHIELRDFTKQLVEDMSFDSTKISLSDKPLWLWGHETQLKRILRELLDNARNFAKSEPNINIRWQNRDTHIELVVSDNNPSIPPNQHSKVFLPFQRISHADSLGMGLTVVKKLAQLGGGDAWLESTESGNSFFVTLKKLMPNIT